MLRLKAVVLCVILIFFLCGCSAKEAVAAEKAEYMVTAIGLDNEFSGLKFMVEAVIVNSDDLTNEKQSRLIEGSGDTVKEAYYSLTEKLTQPLMFSHTGVIVIGDGVKPYQLEELFDFCYEMDEINLAAMFLGCDNAKRLLSCKPLSSVAVGYDLMSAVQVTSEERGVVFKNLFYQSEAARNKPIKVLYLPYFTADGEDFKLEGINVIKENEKTAQLQFAEILPLSLITDSFTNGVFFIENREIRINSAKTTYDFDFNNNLEIVLKINIRPTENIAVIKGQVEELLQKYQNSGTDIFGIGNLIYSMSPKVWERVKGNYNEHFKKADLQVKINE